MIHFLLALILTVGPHAQFVTIGDAVKRLPKDGGAVIQVAAGVYDERIFIGHDHPCVRLEAENPGTVTITSAYSNYTYAEHGEHQAMPLRVEADHFTAKGIVFENTASKPVVAAGGRSAGQAPALDALGDDLRFEDCTFLGHQQTLFLHGPKGKAQRHAVFVNCTIEGAIDFISGNDAALFDRCTIRLTAKGYIAAPSTDPKDTEGFRFRDCRIVCAPGMKRGYLGRPWRPYGRAVYEHCYLGSGLDKYGWQLRGKPGEDGRETVHFAEIGCYGPCANRPLCPDYVKVVSIDKSKNRGIEK